MKRYRICYWLFLVYFLLTTHVFASASHVVAKLIAEQKTLQPGQALQTGLLLTIEKGWHIYWINPGDSGLAPSLEWQLPMGFRSDPLEFPNPERFQNDHSINFGYEREVLLLTKVYPPTTLPQGEMTLKAHAQWLSCKDICVPGETDLALDIPIKMERAKIDVNWKKKFQETRERIPQRIPGWMTFAKTQGNYIVLTLIAPKKSPGSHFLFYPLEEGSFDYQAKPEVSISGKQIDLKLRLDPKRSTPLARLNGVLISESPWVGNSKSMLIDTQIQ